MKDAEVKFLEIFGYELTELPTLQESGDAEVPVEASQPAKRAKKDAGDDVSRKSRPKSIASSGDFVLREKVYLMIAKLFIFYMMRFYQ